MSTELIHQKASRIRALILDVDGVFTDGSFYLTEQGNEIKKFHTHDGVGIKALQAINITIAIISGRSSSAVTHRMQELGITHVYQGVKTKLEIFLPLLKSLALTPAEVAYMGDDLPDLPLIQRAGLGIAPHNATLPVKQHADWVTLKKGGDGAIREVCDFLLRVKTAQQIT